MAAEAVVGAVKAIQEDKNGQGEETSLQPKDFVWDQFLKYISSAILALTILNVSVEFLRGGGVLCFPPPATKYLANVAPDETEFEFSVRQVDYFNGYCSQSIPSSEYFPLYILVHGIMLIAPHFIWNSVFKGDFDSFFAVTRKLDRLRDRNTGEYDPRNFDRVEKLELEFGSKRRKIFLFYIVKLFIQLGVCIVSYIFSIVFFINFSFAFDCPQDFSETNIPEKWPLNTTIPCVYTSLRVLSLIRYADYILLGLAIVLILFGLLWCLIRHTKELGHKEIAHFVFQSCLSTKTFVFPQWHEIRSSQHYSDNCWFCCFPFALFMHNCRGCIWCSAQFMLLTPCIQNDLDFFEMCLFRADTSHGRVFKEIQIDKMLRKLQGEDHQLLHLFLDAQRDMSAQMRERENEERIKKSQRQRMTSQGQSRRPSESQTNEETDGGESSSERPQLTHEVSSSPSVAQSEEPAAVPVQTRIRDLSSFFKMGPGGFSRNPEAFAFVQLRNYLSNIKWRPVEGIRDRLYGFVLYAPKHVTGEHANQPKTNMALDISFGSSGYALVLARAFKKVISVNFHPFFRNEKEPVKKRAFYTNYVDVNFPENIYTQDNTIINKATEKMFEHMKKPKRRPADFLVVGPLGEDSKIVTVTLTIEMLHTVKLIEEGAILLAVRPLKIGHKKMTDVFCKYEPPVELFDHKFHQETVLKDLKEEIGEDEIVIDGFPGIRVQCGETSCIFEFITYKYKGKVKKEEAGTNRDQLEFEQSMPDNDLQQKQVSRSQSMPAPSLGTPYQITPYSSDPHTQPQHYDPQYPTEMQMHGRRQHHHFMRSNTYSGPMPVNNGRTQAPFYPPHSNDGHVFYDDPQPEMYNNEREYSQGNRMVGGKNGIDFEGVAEGRGRGRWLQPGDDVNRPGWNGNQRGVPRSGPGVRYGVAGRGEMLRMSQSSRGRIRHGSGSSVSPLLESMSEADEASSFGGSFDKPDLDSGVSTTDGQ